MGQTVGPDENRGSVQISVPNEKNSNAKGEDRNVKMPESIKKKSLLSLLNKTGNAIFIFLVAGEAHLLVFMHHDFWNEACGSARSITGGGA